MAIPSSTLEKDLIDSARQCAAELLETFTADRFDDEPVSDVCACASATFEKYCGEILNRLLSAVSPVDGAENDWVRGHYLPLVIDFATTMRDAIADPICRHAAAQAIQCKILEHERHLRMVLDSHVDSHVVTPSSSAGL
jgi:hypothetical protein